MECRADDKTAHFAVSAALGAGVETCMHHKTEFKTFDRIMISAAIATIPGVIKEIIDEAAPDNHFDTADLGADVLGAFTGSVIASVLNGAIRSDSLGVTPVKGGLTVNIAHRF